MQTVKEMMAEHPEVIRKLFGDIEELTVDQAWKLLDYTCRNVGYPKREVDDALINWATDIVLTMEEPEERVPRIHCAMPGCHNWIYECSSDRFQVLTPLGAGCICNECLGRLMNETRNKSRQDGPVK